VTLQLHHVPGDQPEVVSLVLRERTDFGRRGVAGARRKQMRLVNLSAERARVKGGDG
jgi:hypothetical protein